MLNRFKSSLITSAGIPDTPWIIALSGGCDSTALACLLYQAHRHPKDRRYVPAEIIAVHVNHALRGAEADADELASRRLTASLGFAFESVKLAPSPDLPHGAREKWARSERYSVLRAIARDRGAGVVLTGHNKNDQAETVLYRLMHGSGIWGLAGIRRSRPLLWDSDVRLARPLLDFTRQDIAHYLAARNQPYQIDSTNQELSYARNRVRHHLLPLLAKAYEGDLIADLDGIARTALSLHTNIDLAAANFLYWNISNDHSLFLSLAEKAASSPLPMRFTNRAPPAAATAHGPASPPSITIRLDDYLRAPRFLRFGMLRLAACCLARRQTPLSRRAFALVEQGLASTDRPGRLGVALGAGLLLRREGPLLLVEKQSSTPPHAAAHAAEAYDDNAASQPASKPEIPRPACLPSRLNVPGSRPLPDGSRLVARLLHDRTQVQKILDDPRPHREVFDADAVGSELIVRTRLRGDTFRPLGSPGRKKLKSFLIDAKVPQHRRDGLLLLCAVTSSGTSPGTSSGTGHDKKRGEILWVVGLRMAEAARVKTTTRRFVVIELEDDSGSNPEIVLHGPTSSGTS